MPDPTGDSLRSRTDSKIRYAEVHLAELTERGAWSGDDFTRAHWESFLFHLLGTQDAFLAELNHYYQCGLPIENLSPGKLREALKTKGVTCAELKVLHCLAQDDASWLRQARDMRDYSTHVQGVARALFMGGADHGKVRLTNPRTNTLTNESFIDQFGIWVSEMRALVLRLRESARKQSGL